MAAAPEEQTALPPPAPSGRWALLVGAGILLSRLAGLLRERVVAHYFGNSSVADALRAAFRIPNLLQNLFGEGVLSASFIPVYARLLAGDNEVEADRVAGSVGAALALAMAIAVAAGVTLAPWLVDLIAPGFEGARRALTVSMVRILFPGVGLLVLSAWCLGILNSHRRFFLSYAAPVVWNLVIVAALLTFAGRRDVEGLALAAAWGAVVGSAAQLAVQLPTTLRLARNLRPANVAFRDPQVGTVFRNFMPAFVSRGVVQISAYVDQLLASLLPIGAVAALGYAQTLYTLPVSLFGMAISAAELPAMSSAIGAETEIARQLNDRLHAALRRVAFLIVPSAVAFAALGDLVTAAIYQTGRFGHSDVLYVWSLLAASAVGLLASTLGRLYASTWYALRDASRPLRFALVRLVFGTALGIVFAFRAPGWLGLDPRWGAAGLPLGSGLAGWLEVALLRRSLVPRVGRVEIGTGFACRLWGVALVAAAAARCGQLAAPSLPPLLGGVAILALYGALYVAGAALLGIRESQAFLRGLRATLTRWRTPP
ncbi:MAG TPA: murein biosynthesis integral membrane protein MurJ [Myxococcota bacterium]|nr:murein biosynthesis integral membrane protein MurJ [Myxococcota bacterium]